METQSVLAVPKGEDKEMDVYASTQHPAFVQVVGARMGVSEHFAQVPQHSPLCVKVLHGLGAGFHPACKTSIFPYVLDIHNIYPQPFMGQQSSPQSSLQVKKIARTY